MLPSPKCFRGLIRMANTADIFPGTLDMLILKAVSLGSLHGYGIARRIEDRDAEPGQQRRELTAAQLVLGVPSNCGDG